MASIELIITNAGLAEVISADQNGFGPSLITEVAFGTGVYAADEDQTQLQDEIVRMTAIAGGAISDTQLHVSARDDGGLSYDAHEVGVFLDSGTLFAVYSQADPIVEKSAISVALIAIDILMTGRVTPAMVEFGDTNFSLNTATSTTEGLVRLATVPESLTGTSDTTASTPEGVRAVVDAIPPVPIATTTTAGRVRRATTGETSSGAAVNAYVTPEGVADYVDPRTHGYIDYLADNPSVNASTPGGMKDKYDNKTLLIRQHTFTIDLSGMKDNSITWFLGTVTGGLVTLEGIDHIYGGGGANIGIAGNVCTARKVDGVVYLYSPPGS